MLNFENVFIDESWMVKVSAIAALTLILSIIVKFSLKHAEKLTDKTKTIWDDAVFKAAERPVFYLIWLIAFKLIFDVVSLEFNDKIFIEANLALKVIIIACISWFLIRLINFIAIDYARRDIAADHTTIDAISKVLKLVVIILSALIMVQNFGFNISGVLAAGGIGGLVIGFAAKDMLANFFGGFTIYLDRPFGVGDWIRCRENDVEGIVEYIGWRHTRVRAFNKNAIYVPNAIFTTIVVENPSRMTNRRLKEVIGLRYCDMAKVGQVCDQVREMVRNHDGIDPSQDILVTLDGFGASSVDLLLNCFTKTVDRGEFCGVKQDIMLKIADIIASNGADIAFPTRTLYLQKD